ncbi:MAG: 4Fe-4S dicluster domain-containing protein [Clostridiales bacterium]|jgi:iron only hydrogenase large subunit-like protein|nr:4Fe-4S dicluster domain-containing protein [Clostridiales bacterium]
MQKGISPQPSFHSVTLDSEKCKGCINCIKRCPTQAIRVRNGKASIISERCIDCGECIRVCQNHAKLPIYDALGALSKYKYTVALPAPALYGQFSHLDNIDIVLNALKAFGFDDVFEVSKAAEIVSDYTRSLMEEDKTLPRPLISSACPAVVRLIRVRFPELLAHLLPLNAPIEVAAKLALAGAQAARPELGRQDIGIIFISPCAAKVTAIRNPVSLAKSEVDAVFAIKDIYPHLLGKMKGIAQLDEEDIPEILSAGRMGISWCGSGGETAALLSENNLAADGIENVIKVLEELEDERLGELDFIELNACTAGCVGGVLTVENPYVAHTRVKRLRKFMPISLNHFTAEQRGALPWDNPVKPGSVMRLADDYEEALAKVQRLNEIRDSLPGLDCGSCGAPTCEALAEDVVRGVAKETDCIFRLRDYVQNLVSDMNKLEGYIPPPFRAPEP